MHKSNFFAPLSFEEKVKAIGFKASCLPMQARESGGTDIHLDKLSRLEIHVLC